MKPEVVRGYLCKISSSFADAAESKSRAMAMGSGALIIQLNNSMVVRSIPMNDLREDSMKLKIAAIVQTP